MCETDIKTALVLALTTWPGLCADRVSLSVKTFPQTEISLQVPGLDSQVKPCCGRITKTPFVVSPSIWLSAHHHFAAFSWKTHEIEHSVYTGNSWTETTCATTPVNTFPLFLFIHWLSESFTYSAIYWFNHQLSFIHSLLFTHIHSLIHLLTQLSDSLTYSLLHWINH